MNAGLCRFIFFFVCFCSPLAIGVIGRSAPALNRRRPVVGAWGAFSRLDRTSQAKWFPSWGGPIPINRHRLDDFPLFLLIELFYKYPETKPCPKNPKPVSRQRVHGGVLTSWGLRGRPFTSASASAPPKRSRSALGAGNKNRLRVLGPRWGVRAGRRRRLKPAANAEGPAGGKSGETSRPRVGAGGFLILHSWFSLRFSARLSCLFSWQNKFSDAIIVVGPAGQARGPARFAAD